MANELPVNEAFLQQIEMLDFLAKNNIAGMFGGNHKSKSYGSSCEFADFRDYMAGDEIKKIDWNAYARFDKLYYKLYLDERQLHTKIYIDASRSMAYGKSGKDVQAIRIAAALAYLSVSLMDKVSVYVIHDNGVEEVISNLLGRDRYYDEVIKLNGIVFDGNSYISQAILPSNVGYGDGLSVIISDFLSDNDYETAIDHLTTKKRDILCLQVLSSEELNPKARGKMHFYDCEDTNLFYRKNINKEIIKAYRQAVAYVTDKIKGYCLSRGASYILASTEDSVNTIFFGKMIDEGVLK